MFDYKNNDYFALITPREGGWSFTSYQADGKTYRAVVGVGQAGRPRNFTVFFGERERVYICPKNKVVTVVVNEDYTNVKEMKLSEYLRKAPYFLQPGFEQFAVYKLIDELKDNKEVVENKAYRIRMENKALELEGDDLREVAQLLNEFSDDSDTQRRAVLEFAGKYPMQFEKLIDSGDRNIRSTVKKAVKAGEIRIDGKTYQWGKDVFAGEDEAVRFFVGNAEKYKVLQANVKRLK